MYGVRGGARDTVWRVRWGKGLDVWRGRDGKRVGGEESRCARQKVSRDELLQFLRACGKDDMLLMLLALFPWQWFSQD